MKKERRHADHRARERAHTAKRWRLRDVVSKKTCGVSAGDGLAFYQPNVSRPAVTVSMVGESVRRVLAGVVLVILASCSAA